MKKSPLWHISLVNDSHFVQVYVGQINLALMMKALLVQAVLMLGQGIKKAVFQEVLMVRGHYICLGLDYILLDWGFVQISAGVR